ncbi:isochorismatase family cysteine hydrolase [Acidianus brierleyi]|uniref:Isochorismatase n=1 Tax=Acidianus brierleyi TaxID=41673 RepID=A0A2U9IGK4_9CREN|nr:isochorismatase family cysteine hydrolase [Acidianus brierleyi]AWR95140.1 isochorismatase family protein [Acidianus brierleyi]
MQSVKEILDPQKSLLVVWDVHLALVNSIFNKDEFLKNLKIVIDSARKASVPILFTKITPYPKGFESTASKIMYRGGFQFKPEEMKLAIEPQENDIILNKNTWSIFVGTNFDLLMKNSARTTIVFTGIATEIGVETSARDAFAYGYVPVIVKDAVSSRNKEAHDRSLENMKSFFPIVTAEELSKIW